ncbi:hypothetical protein EXE53_30760, partial [Halorubrum sp. SD626R]|uniref:hypothetical protein n=1 Tax=Halorubrum sp. SD626R TaxID=1419722 RepID=UPI0010F9286F
MIGIRLRELEQDSAVSTPARVFPAGRKLKPLKSNLWSVGEVIRDPAAELLSEVFFEVLYLRECAVDV